MNHPPPAFLLDSPRNNPLSFSPQLQRCKTRVKAGLNPARGLPCVRHGEAPALADAFIHQQLSEEAGRVPGRAARRNLWRRGSVPGELGQLQLQVHLLLESPDVNLGLGSGAFPGRFPACHRCWWLRAQSISRTKPRLQTLFYSWGRC